jgi:hypothetical protein
MNDPDDPPSREELKRIDEQLDARMPEAVRTELHDAQLSTAPSASTSTSAAHTLVAETAVENVPDMAAHFDLARVDVPDLTGAPPKPATTIAPTR